MDHNPFEERDFVGSFTYKQDEDALRVNVKPQVVDTARCSGLRLRRREAGLGGHYHALEKVAVPFKVHVNVNDLVTASIHRQMQGLNRYYWEGWDDPAGYFLANKINLDEALKDEDLSIQAEERYDNLMNKSKNSGRHGQKTGCRGFAGKGAG